MLIFQTQCDCSLVGVPLDAACTEVLGSIPGWRGLFWGGIPLPRRLRLAQESLKMASLHVES